MRLTRVIGVTTPAFAGLPSAATPECRATAGPAGAGASRTASCQGRGDSRAPAAEVLWLASVGSRFPSKLSLSESGDSRATAVKCRCPPVRLTRGCPRIAPAEGEPASPQHFSRSLESTTAYRAAAEPSPAACSKASAGSSVSSDLSEAHPEGRPGQENPGLEERSTRVLTGCTAVPAGTHGSAGLAPAPPPPPGEGSRSRALTGYAAVPGGSHSSAGLSPAPLPPPGGCNRRSSRVSTGRAAVRAGSHGSAGLAPAPPPPPGGSSRSWAFTRCPAISCETADLPRVSPKGRPQSPPPIPAERQQTPGPR